ncbi:hypothetical protein AKJ08_1729 [Vulgatibacter incomptus]|uniref:Uncharacterized protein n=1 Tax=Vulgatibacter incomptus TaxID=1391653 RepID=A0A0K1PCW3_9BACT|nr:hypothetical protein AKJ08_1729 [Vulgatibacter incomptus]
MLLSLPTPLILRLFGGRASSEDPSPLTIEKAGSSPRGRASGLF